LLMLPKTGGTRQQFSQIPKRFQKTLPVRLSQASLQRAFPVGPSHPGKFSWKRRLAPQYNEINNGLDNTGSFGLDHLAPIIG